MKGDNLRKNASGYSDPTAYQAIMNVDAFVLIMIAAGLFAIAAEIYYSRPIKMIRRRNNEEA